VGDRRPDPLGGSGHRFRIGVEQLPFIGFVDTKLRDGAHGGSGRFPCHMGPQRDNHNLMRYLEDFAVGQTFGSGRLRVDEERIRSFAAEFDPQPFHLDAAAARSSIFRGLAASGWHTAAMTMRLLVESELKPAGGIVGAGFDEFRWPRPVRPGDELHLDIEVMEVRPSKSRPEQGLIKVKTTTVNQNGEAVQVSVGNLVVPRRPVEK
jgi:acyl dehydratase